VNYSNKSIRNMKATNVIAQGEDTCVFYHSTAVVRRHRDGTFTLNSGGHWSVTTKRRINQFTPDGCYLYQKNYDWFINNRKGEPVEFFDGMRLDSEGYPYNGTGRPVKDCGRGL
jgi:hypothetical protein